MKAIQGVVPEPDERDAPHAMVLDDGTRLYPDGPGDAALMAEWHGARPLDPERWPW